MSLTVLKVYEGELIETEGNEVFCSGLGSGFVDVVMLTDAQAEMDALKQRLEAMGDSNGRLTERCIDLASDRDTLAVQVQGMREAIQGALDQPETPEAYHAMMERLAAALSLTPSAAMERVKALEEVARRVKAMKKAVDDSGTGRAYVKADGDWECCMESVRDLLDDEHAPFEADDIVGGLYFNIGAKVVRPEGSEDHLDDETIVTSDPWQELVDALAALDKGSALAKLSAGNTQEKK